MDDIVDIIDTTDIIGPQRAIPSSVSKIQAESKQTKKMLDLIIDTINKEFKVPAKIEWLDKDKKELQK